MIHNFYPGPSTLHPLFEEAINKALETNILSFNHRSKNFHHLYQSCFELLKEKWDIPDGYELYFISSATEAWEIISQSIIGDNPSAHFSNGAFGKKSFINTNLITGKAINHTFSLNSEPQELKQVPRVLNFCLNETSNGSSVSSEILNEYKGKGHIICADVTSCLGGQELDLSHADIWYSSLQKCLGLPSGMAIMLVSQKAIERATEIGDNNHYNSLLKLSNNFKKFETTHTPNILDIFALYYTQVYSDSIEITEQKLRKRKSTFMNEISFENLIKNPSLQSITTICLKCKFSEQLIKEAEEKNIILGKGYGEWKKDTIRIANFPSTTNKSFDQLTNFLSSFQ